MLQGEQALQRRLSAIASDAGSLAVFKRLGTFTVARAQQHTAPNKRTGNLMREIRVEELDARHVVVRSNANYSQALEFGTRPHTITPKRGRALRFAASSAGRRLSGSPRRGADVVFARHVRHPGSRPYPFMRPAFEDVRRATPREFRDGITVLWNRAA